MDKTRHTLTKDPYHALFDYYYRAIVPYSQTRDIDAIRKLGTPVSGVRQIDQSTEKEMIVTMCCIAQMAEHYQNGVQVIIPDKNDVKTIYEVITAHLVRWRDQLRLGINIGDSPISDLILLDEFANTIYGVRKQDIYEPDSVHSQLALHLKQTSPINSFNFFKSNVSYENGVTRINATDDTIPDRDSLSAYFKSVLSSFGRV